MKSISDLVPAERLLLATLKLSPEPLAFEEWVQQSGYRQSVHMKMCVRYLVSRGLVAEMTKRDGTRLYALPGAKAARP